MKLTDASYSMIKRIGTMRAIWISLLLSIGGCSSSPNQPIFPEPDMTMKEVYESGSQGYQQGSNTNSKGVLKRPARPSERAVDPYIVHDTVRTNFRKLDNPTMILFVNTQLTNETRIPIPAYMTEFKLLDRDEYALPGEQSINGW